jgi:histone acetyltransferase (RNA polymerase elongator complex component)
MIKMRHYNIPIFIPHLGCPFDCIYCDQKKIAAQVGVPAIGEVKETIDVHLSTIPADAEVEVAFFGGSFTAVDKGLQAQYLEAVQDYIKDGRVAGIRLSTRPDFINQDILDFLAFYGVKTIELGVQSMDDGVLQASARSYTSADVIKSSRLIRQRQFDLGVQLMIGLPGDNRQLDIETTRRVIDLHPRQVRIYPTLVISGTHLQTMLDRGDYRPLSLQEAIDTCKEMSLMFQAHHIRVIRMGLYPGEGLRSPGVVAAGPFHPQLRGTG